MLKSTKKRQRKTILVHSESFDRIMKLTISLLVILIAAVSAREIELGTFTPSSNSDLDLIDYGTVRVTKVKKNHYTISGDFFLKQNLANDKTVKAFAISFF